MPEDCMTEKEFVEKVRQRQAYLQGHLRSLVECTGTTPEQTIAKCEMAAFIGELPIWLQMVDNQELH